jgi:MFS family permease
LRCGRALALAIVGPRDHPEAASVSVQATVGAGGGETSFLKATLSCWALFLGFAFMVVGHGLLGSLLGNRLTLEGHPTGTSGLVMSGFFVGIVTAGLLAPRLIGRVGHIRVFAAMGAICSAVALLHSLWVEPVFWFLLRATTGFAATTMYVVVESWVNDRARNEFRGRLLSVYMLVWLSCMTGGFYLIAVIESGGTLAFLIVAICFGLSVVPLALATAGAPDYAAPVPISIRRLWQASPLGTLGAVFIGLVHGTLVGMASVYAASVGLTNDRVGIITAAIFAGGLVLQMPIGRLSDRRDRRLVLAGVSLLAAGVAVGALLLGRISFWGEVAAIAIFGGLCLPLYTLVLAVANDRLTQREMVGASATLYLLLGLGAAVGPPVAGFLMQLDAAAGFYLYMAALLAMLAVFALWRRQRRAAPPQTASALPAAPVAPPPSQMT